jgi:hypothetical protein
MSLVKPTGISGLSAGHPLNADIAQFFEFGQTNKDLVSDAAFTYNGVAGAVADIGVSVLVTAATVGTSAVLNVSNNNTVLVIYKHVGSGAGHAGAAGEFRFAYGEANGDAFDLKYSPFSNRRYETSLRANSSSYSKTVYDPYDNPGYVLPHALAFSFDVTAAGTPFRTLYLDGTEQTPTITEAVIGQAFNVTPVAANMLSACGSTGDTRVAAIVRFSKRLSAAEMASITTDPWTMVATSTADTTAPTFNTAPAVTATSETGHTIASTLNESGTLYGVRLASGATAPSSAQVVAGQNNTGAAALEPVSVAATAATSADLTFSTGAASTAYDYYIVAQDDEGAPNLQAAPTLVSATTAAAAVPGIGQLTVQFEGVAINVADWHIITRLAADQSILYNQTAISSDVSGNIAAFATTSGSVGDAVRVEGHSVADAYSFVIKQNLGNIA